ncbi:Type IV pilus biogenesis protein PilE [hydrothermal vent metagenome]|uniref:Type IV pilus biogenesis protein PilE n=1 Tax=hydrothermal vent metagenome TaxID=652676 RepID=A0A3B0Y2Y3_9ZZZZ
MNIQVNKGFTLIELVIALAIVGVLAAIAFPSYTDYVRQARRGDCASELVLYANALERFSTARGTYVGGAANYPTQCLTSGGMAAAGPAGPGPAVAGTSAYNFVINAVTASTFTIQAVPAAGPQAFDKCGTLTLTNTGIRGISGADAGVMPEDCW